MNSTGYRLTEATKILRLKREIEVLRLIADGKLYARVKHPERKDYWIIDAKCIDDMLCLPYWRGSRFCPIWWSLAHTIDGTDFTKETIRVFSSDIEMYRALHMRSDYVLHNSKRKFSSGEHWKIKHSALERLANLILTSSLGRRKYFIGLNRKTNARGLAREVMKQAPTVPEFKGSKFGLTLRSVADVIRKGIKERRIPSNYQKGTE